MGACASRYVPARLRRVALADNTILFAARFPAFYRLLTRPARPTIRLSSSREKADLLRGIYTQHPRSPYSIYRGCFPLAHCALPSSVPFPLLSSRRPCARFALPCLLPILLLRLSFQCSSTSSMQCRAVNYYRTSRCSPYTVRLRRPPIFNPTQRGSPTPYTDVSHSPTAPSPQLPFPLVFPTPPCASRSRASSKAPSRHFFFIRSPPRSFRADTGHLLPYLPSIFLLLASHSHPARLNMRILLPSVDILVRTPPRSLQHGRNAWRVAVLCTF